MSAMFLLVLLVATSVSANLIYLDHELCLRGEDKFRDEFTRKRGRGEAWKTWDCQNISSVPDDVRTAMPLDDFYQKYTHAYGIPIVSSGNPSDEALTRACYVVRFMLADRKDIRDSMYDSYGRVGVIGLHEKTTDIPEHSYLPSSVDDRARGLGGTRSTPISTDAEENLLCGNYLSDGWYEEDILVHEFAHAIHVISLKNVDKTFDKRLKAAWKAAKAANLWKHTYAITRRHEYFAEGVQSYFNVQTHREVIDMVHNAISTRQALYDYDRTLYDLIEEVFPCKQIIVDRCLANNQELTAAQELQMDCELCPGR